MHTYMAETLGKIKLGLGENWKQFTLLVIINGFVGGMVGLERSILPQIAEQEFDIAATNLKKHQWKKCHKKVFPLVYHSYRTYSRNATL